MQICLNEHRVNVRRDNTSRSKIVQHVCESQHKFLWTDAKIINKEEKWLKSRFKETAFIIISNNYISQMSETPNIWVQTIHNMTHLFHVLWYCSVVFSCSALMFSFL